MVTKQRGSLTQQRRRRLRMANGTDDHAVVFEPLAVAIRQAMDASGISQAEVCRITGLSKQTVGNLVNRRKPYRRQPPRPETQQALAAIPGLSIGVVQQAVARSLGMAIRDDRPEASQLRQSAHNIVDQIPEGELQRVVQILAAMI